MISNSKMKVRAKRIAVRALTRSHLFSAQRVSSRAALDGEGPRSRRLRYSSDGGCRPGVDAFPRRKPATASAIRAASTLDWRALINCVIALATGRSLAVSAARDDTRFFGFPAFKLEDAKHIRSDRNSKREARNDSDTSPTYGLGIRQCGLEL